mgnify:CR=1 FL=1
MITDPVQLAYERVRQWVAEAKHTNAQDDILTLVEDFTNDYNYYYQSLEPIEYQEVVDVVVDYYTGLEQ